jgi:hypothetical protein
MRRPKTPYRATQEELAAIDEALSEQHPGLTQAEWSALVELLRQTIAADRYPLSARTKMLKSIMAKIEVPAPKPDPFPSPKAPGERSTALHKKRRR